MPHNPHWYTLREKWANDRDFVDAVHFIWANGVKERYPPGRRGREYIVLYLNGYRYWTMPNEKCEVGPYHRSRDVILINRNRDFASPQGSDTGAAG